MPVWMRMWLRTFPAFVLVLVMLVVHMKMLVVDLVVDMLQLGGITSGPDDQSGGCRGNAERAEHAECRHEAERTAQPSGKRVGDQPARMGEGELGGVDGGPVAFPGRAFEEPPRRRLNQRGAGTEEAPDQK